MGVKNSPSPLAPRLGEGKRHPVSLRGARENRERAGRGETDLRSFLEEMMSKSGLKETRSHVEIVQKERACRKECHQGGDTGFSAL